MSPRVCWFLVAVALMFDATYAAGAILLVWQAWGDKR